MEKKNEEKFKKVDYRPWDLIGLDKTIKNEDAKKVINAKVEKSNIDIDKFINKAVLIKNNEKEKKIDFFKVVTLGSSPISMESGLFPVSTYLKDCFNIQMNYFDGLRKVSSDSLLNLCFNW